jgi:hypothetical protein
MASLNATGSQKFAPVILSISIFEDRQGASESSRKAAEFVQKDLLRDQLSKPEVLEGELLVLKEAAVGVR